MAYSIERTIPQQKLRQLDFLLGDSLGMETLYPPGRPSVRFEAACSVSREDCERFVQVKFFADIPTLGVETFTGMITYSEKETAYKMWVFASSTEEPLCMKGDFADDKLIFVSDPWPMPWGLQRIRSTFTPHSDGSVEYLSELWEPDGYTKYCTVVFHKQP